MLSLLKIDLIIMNFLEKNYSLRKLKNLRQVPINQSEGVPHKRKVDLEVTRRSERLKRSSSILSSSKFYTYVGESFERIRLNEDLLDPRIYKEAITDIDAEKCRLVM